MYRTLLPVLLYAITIAAAPQDTVNSDITYVKIQPVADESIPPKTPVRESRIENLPTPTIIGVNASQDFVNLTVIDSQESEGNRSETENDPIELEPDLNKTKVPTGKEEDLTKIKDDQPKNEEIPIQSKDNLTTQQNKPIRRAYNPKKSQNKTEDTPERKDNTTKRQNPTKRESNPNRQLIGDDTTLLNDNLSLSDGNQPDNPRLVRSEDTTSGYEADTAEPTEGVTESVEELIQQTEEYEARTRAPSPRFLSKLSYFQKDEEVKSPIATNLVERTGKRHFKSKCRCEKIWNCPKLQITVPRCPNEYFLCCF